MIDHAKELRRFASVLGKPTIMLDAADEIERLAARLEAAERERDECNRRRLEAADHFATQTALMKKKYDELRAKIEQMEQQEPVAHVWRCDNGHIHGSSERFLPMGTKLYALPGAQPAPSVPDHKTIRDLLNESGLCAYDREGDLAFMVAATKFAALAAAPETKP